jgi:general secretion pathway protein M
VNFPSIPKIPNIPRKGSVIIGGGCFALVLLLFVVILPLRSYTKHLDGRIDQAKEQLVQLNLLTEEYRRAQAQAPKSRDVQRDQRFTLFSFLEDAASRDGIKDRIEFMRPGENLGEGGVREEIVEMRLSTIRLAKLIPFLHKIETGPEMVTVRRLTIRAQTRDPGLLDVDLTAVTIKAGTS